MIWTILISTWVLSGVISCLTYIIKEKILPKESKDPSDDFKMGVILSLIFGYASFVVTLIVLGHYAILALFKWVNTEKPKTEIPVIYKTDVTSYRDSANI